MGISKNHIKRIGACMSLSIAIIMRVHVGLQCQGNLQPSLNSETSIGKPMYLIYQKDLNL